MLSFYNLMNSNKQDAQLLFLEPFIQLVTDLIGDSASRATTGYIDDKQRMRPTLNTGTNTDSSNRNVALLKGDYFDIDADLKHVMETGNAIVVSWIYFLQLFVCALLNDYTTAYQAMLELNKSNTDAFPPHNTAYWMLFEGIISLSIQPESLQDVQRAKQCLRKVKTIVKHSPSNYKHIATLLEAELLAYKVNHRRRNCKASLLSAYSSGCLNPSRSGGSNNIVDDVIAKYTEAAMEARDQGFVLVQALAYERLGRFHQIQRQIQENEEGTLRRSFRRLTQSLTSDGGENAEQEDENDKETKSVWKEARTLYASWGAHTKARQLLEHMLILEEQRKAS